MKREYKITKSDLGYHVYRKKEENWIMRMERLQRDSYTLNRDFARTFYHLDDALSNLQIAKAREWKEKETPITSTRKSESEEVREKTSWSEL